ncbi:MAG: hypothetical protein RL742_1926 [Bacteroidota bacterium]
MDNSKSEHAEGAEQRIYEAAHEVFLQKGYDAAMMTSITLAREKELGTMEVLLVSPLRPIQILLGKTIPYLLLSMLNAVIVMLLGIFVFGMPMRGSIALLDGPAATAPAVIEIAYSNWYNPRLDYKTFMVPGILGLIVSMVICFLTALSIVREREIGTIAQMNVTPATRQA